MLTGMYLSEHDEKKKNEPLPKAMLIHTGKSDDSMSDVTTTSKSTQGKITQDKDVNGHELTCESAFFNEREKISNIVQNMI